MPLLEDRLLRIIELREAGSSDETIAHDLKIEQGMVSRYENTTKQTIEEAVKKGVDNPDKLSKRMNISPVVLGMFMDYYHIGFSPPKKERRARHTMEESLTKIREAAADGTKTAREVAEMTGFAYGTVKVYASLGKIRLDDARHRYHPRVNLGERAAVDRPKLIGQIKSLIEKEGVRSFVELSRRMRYGKSKLGPLLEEISLPEDFVLGWRSEMDSLINEGYNTGEISRKMSTTHQAVEDYLKKSGQKKYWKEIRKKGKEERKRKETEPRQNFLSLLEQRIEQMAKEQGWACQKTIEYFGKTRRESPVHGFDNILNLFETYQQAREKGGRIGWWKLGEAVGMGGTQVGKIFERVGVASLYWNLKRRTHQEIKEKKERVYRGIRAGLSAPDIAYFLGENVFNVRNYLTRAKVSLPKVRPIKQFGKHQKEILTRRLASQVYEEMDKGDLSEAEIAFCLDMPAVMMFYTLENRKKGRNIGREIVQALRKMYPEEDIKTPYR